MSVEQLIIVSSGQTFNLPVPLASSVLIDVLNFGTLNVLSGGAATGTIDTGLVNVSAGGFLTGTSIDGGALEIFSGGLVSGTTMSDGGRIDVFAGGTAVSTTVNGGQFDGLSDLAELLVLSGGIASGTVVNSSFAEIRGTASNTTVNAGGSFGTDRGAFATGTVVNSGGSEAVGGTAVGTVVNSGGTQFVASTGLASATIVNSGGVQVLRNTGVGTILNGGGAIVSAGGSEIGMTINSGGLAAVFLSGATANTTINSGGTEFVLSGGEADATMISGGGLLVVSSGGHIIGPITFAGAGGTEFILDATAPSGEIHGFAPGDRIELGTVLFDPAGALELRQSNILRIVENFTTYELDFDPAQSFSSSLFRLSSNNSGGTEVTVVSSGGLAIGTHVPVFGQQIVSAGGHCARFRARCSRYHCARRASTDAP